MSQTKMQICDYTLKNNDYTNGSEPFFNAAITSRPFELAQWMAT